MTMAATECIPLLLLSAGEATTTPDNMTSNDNNSKSLDLLRVTVLSLEGVQLFSSANGNDSDDDDDDDDDATKNANDHRIVTAWVGFRSSYPPEKMAVPCSQYSTLFPTTDAEEDDGKNLLLAVGSEEVAWNEDVNFGMAMHWRNDRDNKEHSPRAVTDGTDTITNSTSRELIPHLQVKLPSTTTTPANTNGVDATRLMDTIKFHVCVVCESSFADDHSFIGEEFDGDDNDSLGSGEHGKREQQHVCRGVAQLKFSPSEVDRYNRQEGKVALLPVKQSESSLDENESNDVIVTFAKNIVLSVQVQKVSVPIEQFEEKEQRHYMESDWTRGESFAPVSVIHGASIKSNEKDAGNNGGFGQLCRKATSTLARMTTPTRQLTASKTTTSAMMPLPPPKMEKRDEMVGKIIEAVDSRCPSNIVHASSSDQRQTNETLERVGTSHKPAVIPYLRKKYSETKSSSKQARGVSSSDPSNKSLSQKLGEKVLCGHSFGDALKMAAAAGHHCDEDHVGLYVIDTESLSSSIDTGDVMGF